MIAAVAILLLAAAGLCLLDGDHDDLDLCHIVLLAGVGAPLVGPLLMSALAMPSAPPHTLLVPARTAPAPI